MASSVERTRSPPTTPSQAPPHLLRQERSKSPGSDFGCYVLISPLLTCGLLHRTDPARTYLQRCCIYDTLVSLGGMSVGRTTTPSAETADTPPKQGGEPDFMNIEWTILPRGDVAPHWSGLYVTMNRIGSIVMSRVTHERLGEPAAVFIMFDRFNSRLGLKPAKVGERNAYPVRNYGRRGAQIVRAFRIVTEFGIRPPDTIEFQKPKIDLDGQLILDLRTIRISPKGPFAVPSR